MIFSWHPDVCVCVCVCVQFSMFQTPITYKRLDISIWNLVHQWINYNSLIFDYFHDNWCRICNFVGFWIFWKKDVVVLTFVKLELSPYTQIYHIDQGTSVLNLAQIHSSVQYFSDFEFFENFLKIVEIRHISIYRAKISCVNALILSDVWYQIL